MHRSKGYSGVIAEQGWVSEIYGMGVHGPAGHTIEPTKMDWTGFKSGKPKNQWKAVYVLSSGLYHVHEAHNNDYYLHVTATASAKLDIAQATVVAKSISVDPLLT